MKQVRWIVPVLLAAAGTLAVTTAAVRAQDPAVMTVGGGSVEWRSLIETSGLVLTVSGPRGVITRQAFSGSIASFSLYTSDGQVRPDGVYTYELQIAPRVSDALRRQLQAARAAGAPDQSGEASLPKGATQSGSFAIRGGAFVTSSQESKQSTTTQTTTSPQPADVVTPDDMIIQGSLCVGLDCVNNESFGFDTVRLKENNTRIKFDDTSVSAGFAANDWQITANDSASGGASKFSIEDITGAKVPFTVTAGAPTNSIFVDSMGRLGLRTSTPVLDVHANTGNTPALRFEQNNTGGFTAQTWDVAGNEANFFVRDVTSGSRLPFRIRPGAPTSSIDIAADGKVGIGTGSPQAQIHVFGTETQDVFGGMGFNLASGPGFNFGYAGASFGRSAGFFNVRPDASAVAPNPSLRFATANVTRMIIDNEGFVGLGVANPANPIELASGALVTAGGVWTNASSREFKQDIETLSSEEAMEALQGLSPVRFAYKADVHEKHVGFIAEDVPALVATPDRKGLSAMDVVAVLTKVVQEQQRVINDLTEKVSALEAQGRER